MHEPATKAEATGSWALWFGVLGGPFAWITQLVIGTELPEFMCAVGAGDSSIYGIGIETVIQSISLAMTALTVLAGIVALGCWRRTRDGDPATGGRPAWMALAGIITSCLFLILIIPGLFPAGFLTECGRSL